MGYYAQAVHGQFALLAAAKAIPTWLDDPATPEDLKRRLLRAQKIRAFASEKLGLPDNRSYTEYADLHRPAAVWNVFAAPELSLQLKTWCYPFFGCAGYRGYFDKADAEQLAGELRTEGYEVNVAPVPAYSTLGWFDDPILNTFINQGEAELARLIFHELAHQLLYVKDDTEFNESFATTVERVGVQRWLAAESDATTRDAYAVQEQRRADFLALLREHRDLLAAAYASPVDDATKRERKRDIFAHLQTAYVRLRTERWGSWGGYDRYFAQPLNNAHLAAIAAYNDLVPNFMALLHAEGDDLPRFYARVRKLAQEDREQRTRDLQAALAPE
ncbi:MAG TPA: aminopeptidase [Burkholderiaceae bacterium]|nr:aminopeptidase [Burkholderiaceae bacterium]